jgi:hypothetical protein
VLSNMKNRVTWEYSISTCSIYQTAQHSTAQHSWL